VGDCERGYKRAGCISECDAPRFEFYRALCRRCSVCLQGVLSATAPSSVPGIMFLSSGQYSFKAVTYLDVINKAANKARAHHPIHHIRSLQSTRLGDAVLVRAARRRIWEGWNLMADENNMKAKGKRRSRSIGAMAGVVCKWGWKVPRFRRMNSFSTACIVLPNIHPLLYHIQNTFKHMRLY
jgi:hypothetical protein